MLQKLLTRRSLPLTKKRASPAVPCVAYLYSEDMEVVFHVFASENLHLALTTGLRSEIAKALLQDPSDRVAWVKSVDEVKRKHLLHRMQSEFDVAA